MKKSPVGEKSVSSQITNKKIILSIIVGFFALLYIEIEGRKVVEKIKAPRISAVVLPLPKCKEAQDVALWSNCQGKQLFPNGEKYAGEFNNGKISGQGTYTWFNGDQYIGQFVDGSTNGYGSLTFAIGDTYVGEVKDNQFHGKGTFTHADGTQYVGEHKKGKRSGLGTLTYSAGIKYTGKWKNDARIGSGTYTYPSGKVVTGKWLNKYFQTEDRNLNIYSKINASGYYKTAENQIPLLNNPTKYPFRNDKNVFSQITEEHSTDFYSYRKTQTPIQKVTFPGVSREEGVHEFLSKNGSRKRIETWRKGKLIRKVNFVNGELNGMYDMYNEKGQLETRITFKNGLKDGNMYEFLPNGFVERIRTFNKGRLIADKKLYPK